MTPNLPLPLERRQVIKGWNIGHLCLRCLQWCAYKVMKEGGKWSHTTGSALAEGLGEGDQSSKAFFLVIYGLF